MQQIHNLKHHLLIAMPQLNDSWFEGAVIYLCEYNDEGAMGLALNQVLDVEFSDICQQLSLPCMASVQPAILSGGPVSQEHGFILHRQLGDWQSSMSIAADAHLTSSKDILEAIAVGEGPQHYRIALGYSGWSAGQLDEELRSNSWLTLEATPELIYETAAEDLYAQALAKLGVSPEFLSAQSGRA